MKIDFPCVVSIAGSDSSGGAGIQADIKAISATGAYAATVITALTAQNTRGVQAIEEVPASFVQQQCESIFSDLKIHAVKIGMLYRADIVEVVAAALEKFKPKHVVIDPVMIAKQGCELLLPETIHILKAKLFSYAALLTPNVPEAEKLLDLKIDSKNTQALAAKKLGQQFKINVLVKGGHLMQQEASDVLYTRANDQCFWFHSERIASKNTHGTGCSLSSAIASYLAQNYQLEHAIAAAKKYLTAAITHAVNLEMGSGSGPINHFYMLKNKTYDI